MKWINRLYIFFLGIILSITTGFGLAAFYPQPVMPQYPVSSYANPVPSSCYSTPQEQQSSACQVAIQKAQQASTSQTNQEQTYQQRLSDYNNANAGYTRTAVFFGIVIGAIFALLGLILIRMSHLVANGLLLGALLTAILTRLLVSLASLGASATGTSSTDSLSVVEFAVLVILSIVVVGVGMFSLKEQTTPVA